MSELILFPNAQAVVAGFLRDEGFARVERVVPNPRPTGELIVVRRTGGPRQTIVSDNAFLTVESWHDTDADAHDLAQEVRGLLHTLPGQIVDGTVVYGVDELAGPADLPDPLSNQARYTQSFAVHLRGAVTGS